MFLIETTISNIWKCVRLDGYKEKNDGEASKKKRQVANGEGKCGKTRMNGRKETSWKEGKNVINFAANNKFSKKILFALRDRTERTMICMEILQF